MGAEVAEKKMGESLLLEVLEKLKSQAQVLNTETCLIKERLDAIHGEVPGKLQGKDALDRTGNGLIGEIQERIDMISNTIDFLQTQRQRLEVIV